MSVRFYRKKILWSKKRSLMSKLIIESTGWSGTVSYLFPTIQEGHASVVL